MVVNVFVVTRYGVVGVVGVVASCAPSPTKKKALREHPCTCSQSESLGDVA